MGYMYFASRIIFFKQFLVPLVWFQFHIGPTVSVGNVVSFGNVLFSVVRLLAPHRTPNLVDQMCLRMY